MAKKKAKSKKNPLRAPAKRKTNPPKFKRVMKTSGWIPASAVKFVKRRGQPVEVLVRKPGKKRKSKKGR